MKKTVTRNGINSSFVVALWLWLSVGTTVNAQQVEWNVKATGFFDNLEYSSPYRESQTMDGLWVQPSLALRWDEHHSLHAGYGARVNWGSGKSMEDPTLELYYEYNTEPARFLLGSFSRDELRGDWPTGLFSDSVRYYDPMIEGLLFQSAKGKNYIEGFLDWTGCRSRERREQFMAGASGLIARDMFQMGFQGYYYHYARRTDAPSDEYVRDYGVANVFLGLDLSEKTALDSLMLRVGMLADIERDRQFMSHWDFNPGLLVEATAVWRNLYLKNTLYAGRGQQVNGSDGYGKWYWADGLYRSKLYDRTDFLFRFIRNRYANAYIGASTHFDHEGNFSWQQRVTLAVNIGTIKHHHQRLPF